MTLATNEKSIELNYSTRNVVKILDAFETNNIKDVVFDGLNKMDVRKLAIIIQQLASPEKWLITDIYDFIDAYKTEHECTIKDIYVDIINDFNDNYFFDAKMTPEELEETIKNPLAIGMEEIMMRAVKQSIEQIATEKVMNYAT